MYGPQFKKNQHILGKKLLLMFSQNVLYFFLLAKFDVCLEIVVILFILAKYVLESSICKYSIKKV